MKIYNLQHYVNFYIWNKTVAMVTTVTVQWKYVADETAVPSQRYEMIWQQNRPRNNYGIYNYTDLPIGGNNISQEASFVHTFFFIHYGSGRYSTGNPCWTEKKIKSNNYYWKYMFNFPGDSYCFFMSITWTVYGRDSCLYNVTRLPSHTYTTMVKTFYAQKKCLMKSQQNNAFFPLFLQVGN